MIGFVLVSCAPSKELEVYRDVLTVQGVVEAHPLFGEFDIIAKVTADSLDGIGAVTMTIREFPGVVDTKTLTSPEGFY